MCLCVRLNVSSVSYQSVSLDHQKGLLNLSNCSQQIFPGLFWLRTKKQKYRYIFTCFQELWLEHHHSRRKSFKTNALSLWLMIFLNLLDLQTSLKMWSVSLYTACEKGRVPCCHAVYLRFILFSKVHVRRDGFRISKLYLSFSCVWDWLWFSSGCGPKIKQWLQM